MKEIWKDIPGFEGYYQASNLGQIRRVKGGKGTKNVEGKPHILKGGYNRRGYRVVSLCKDKTKSSFLWHRVVMLAFVGFSNLQVNHKDGIKANNCLTNLEYVTNKENHKHAKDFNLLTVGESQGSSKLKEYQAVEILLELLYGERTQEEISKRYNVGRTTISAIKNGRTWGHVNV